MKRHRKSVTRRPLTTLLACGLTVLAMSLSESLAEDHGTDSLKSAAQPDALSDAFRRAAVGVLPTVVRVKTTIRPHLAPGWSWREDPFAEAPSAPLVDAGFGARAGRSFTPGYQGQGSGVIIDSAGVVLTANHIVEGADAVIVELPDGRDLRAVDIRTDPLTDLAMVWVKAKETLPVAHLGDSDKSKVGDWVLAIGSPFGMKASVSAGIISAKGRSLRLLERARLLQTDADINPGNSGGPLVNLLGEVIGINTAFASANGDCEGVGFAVPVNVAKWVAGQLLKERAVTRAYLGARMQPLTPELARQLSADPGNTGVVVREVHPGTPAATARLQPGDVVTHFAGKPVATPWQLLEAVERSRPGTRKAVRILRNGQPATLNVEMDRLPASPVRSRSWNERGTVMRLGHRDPQLGLEVQDLRSELARQLGYDESSEGIVITEADPEGIAYEEGLRGGMLILRVGTKSIRSIQDFESALAEQSLENGILFLVKTPDEGNRFVVIK
ncbi:MAG: trypsin-like peptidase domain-containing protein [Planctomycetes bacterium]|nr:trypsin-like peptidase domain-containing protein [Planctomycetota bacterium]